MGKDYSKYIKKEIKKYHSKGIEFGKPKKLLAFQGNIKEDELEKELLNLDYLTFTEKQIKDKEIRYCLYFVHSNRRGKAFVITFREKIRLITIFHLGRKTLIKYKDKKFKKGGSLKKA